ncbi:MAG: hypothetical protein J7M40_13420 [Planctomycetes bacterium]|nr:hypothetical protein [Planctomycetota bacterium]
MILGMLIGAEFIPNDSMDADISMTPLKGKDFDELPANTMLAMPKFLATFVPPILMGVVELECFRPPLHPTA